MLVLRATAKLLQRIGPATLHYDDRPTTLLGEWYATALPWRPQTALLVNETTLLPVLMPLASAATLTKRIPDQIAATLTAHDVPTAVIDDELESMQDVRVGKTANRSVVGIMTDFSYLAGVYRENQPDLLALTLRLARTPCSPLRRTHGSPDRALRALVTAG
ncbi:DUF6933 domain-containing protein [Dactylosporangium sp. CA-052675]|uniref:DUF6933 domain-containing protein n=1 Tax=Dactylosporangium sp. CA-052675 TaxID=3239927 RepID=UPI003D8A569C